jgi:uncharacterized membrane protein (TIGR02234 family)
VNPRRELRTAVLLCLLGSGLVLLAVRQTWASYPTSGGLTIDDVRDDIHGTAVAGLAQALSLVGIAGVVAIAATKRRGRVVVGTLVALAGLFVVVDVVDLLARGLGHRLATAAQQQHDTQPTWFWPVLTLVGGVVMTAGGAVVAARGRRWAALSSAYQVPAAQQDDPPATDKGTWDALDRGHDPTV